MFCCGRGCYSGVGDGLLRVRGIAGIAVDAQSDRCGHLLFCGHLRAFFREAVGSGASFCSRRRGGVCLVGNARHGLCIGGAESAGRCALSVGDRPHVVCVHPNPREPTLVIVV